jgi:hypothetical protein
MYPRRGYTGLSKTTPKGVPPTSEFGQKCDQIHEKTVFLVQKVLFWQKSKKGQKLIRPLAEFKTEKTEKTEKTVF